MGNEVNYSQDHQFLCQHVIGIEVGKLKMFDLYNAASGLKSYKFPF